MGIWGTWCHKIKAYLKSLLLRAVNALAVDETTDRNMMITAFKEMFNVIKNIDNKVDGIAETNDARYMMVDANVRVLKTEVTTVKKMVKPTMPAHTPGTHKQAATATKKQDATATKKKGAATKKQGAATAKKQGATTTKKQGAATTKKQGTTAAKKQGTTTTEKQSTAAVLPSGRQIDSPIARRAFFERDEIPEPLDSVEVDDAIMEPQDDPVQDAMAALPQQETSSTLRRSTRERVVLNQQIYRGPVTVTDRDTLEERLCENCLSKPENGTGVCMQHIMKGH